MGDEETKSAKPRTGPKFRKPRVKLNFSRNLAGALTSNDGPKTKPYMQGYDRELDSEDEETGEGMAFEEQLILRLPEGPGVNGELDQLRKTIKKRGTLPDTWFKFKDSRRAVFYIAGQPYAAKIVDLPCIVESHKTLDNKQIFKIADISQMLLVERPVANESEAVEAAASSTREAGQAKVGFNADDYIYPHGITPPMHWARKRRFRKRIHNRGIDTVEKEVENLLNDDRRAEKVEYEFVDPAEADAIEEEIANTKYEQKDMDHDGDDSQMHGSGDEDDGDSRRGGDDDDENVDQVLAAELDAALTREQGGEGDESASNSDNDNDNSDEERSRADSDLEDLWDDEENEDGDDNEENEPENEAENDADKDDDDGDGEEEAERRVRESQLEAECREIETMIRRKQHDIDATLNALIKSRHQQALRKLQVEFDLKKKHLQDIKQLRRAIREERAAEAEARAEARAESAAASAAANGTPGAAGDAPETSPSNDAHTGKAPEPSGP